MSTSLRHILLALLFCPVFVQTLHAQRVESVDRPLARAIQKVVDDPAFRGASLGIAVYDLNNHRYLYRLNTQTSFIPASNLKLFTTAAALELLGPDFRYDTFVFTDGPIIDGVLRGNLIILGSGDPTIGKRIQKEDMVSVFRQWADSLKLVGIERITGDIIGDDDVFDDVPLGPGWPWDDEPYWYAAEMGGLVFNENAVDFIMEGFQKGRRTRVRWEPFNTNYVTVTNRTSTTSSKSKLREGYTRPRGTNTIILSSSVPQGTVDKESLSIHNATLFFTHTLKEVLVREGIDVEGEPVDVDALSEKPDYESDRLMLIATYTSPPLPDLIQVINKESINLYADQLLKTVGLYEDSGDQGEPVGTLEGGIRASKSFFADIGIDTVQLQMVDGSGLSRLNLVSPEMIVTLLDYMWNSTDDQIRDVFFQSLPISGVDGSLEKRFTEESVKGRIHAKTGTISRVSTLSGYLTTRRRRFFAFSIMVNNYRTKTTKAREVTDEIVNILVRDPD